ncbi:MAG TPA: hypothetical protein PKA28_10930 [Methylomusa anaerophila]|uniref:Uncharacterized protein n=1 Tax=Methylomusa anaerophila TaxID=1930071 RepID=A0A348AJ26_9FIRM|nr:hypothetical protein [Methylomusa anaerophila]BBB91074.1 hypothetical protein MAMMFC1_01742 [Methylomusa anaerophila]HML88949.1 hypothetical protein [Methylomusa anaerophila]
MNANDLKNKINETGAKFDDKVQETGKFLGLPTWAVWLIVTLAVVGAVTVVVGVI